MEEASKEILRFWKTQWEAYMKSMMAMQDQGETMLEMIQKSGVLQEGSQKMVKEWADKYKVIQKTYGLRFYMKMRRKRGFTVH
jgi:Cys-tRNA synthase (O-phospho-L-seryl-tRNA:Cys-tRNA synthase)